MEAAFPPIPQPQSSNKIHLIKSPSKTIKKIKDFLILPLSDRAMLFVTSISLLFSHTYSMGNSTCQADLTEEVRIFCSTPSNFPDYQSNKRTLIICQSRPEWNWLSFNYLTYPIGGFYDSSYSPNAYQVLQRYVLQQSLWSRWWWTHPDVFAMWNMQRRLSFRLSDGISSGQTVLRMWSTATLCGCVYPATPVPRFAPRKSL